MSNIKNNPSEVEDPEIEELFKNASFPTELTVDLPSKGKFYKNFKRLFVTPLTFKDEQRIFGNKTKGSDPVNEILQNCVHGVHVEDLLNMDKSFILLKIKEVSYGPNYNFSIICPNCNDHCEVKIDLSTQLKVKTIPHDLEDPRVVHLPVLNTSAVVKFPRGGDADYLKDTETIELNLFRFVNSINGNENPVFIAKVIKKMHLRDIKTLISQILRDDLGLDPKFQFTCPTCSYDTVMGVPFSTSFFSVS